MNEAVHDHVMVTRTRASELAGIREGRLAYWERTDLIRPTARAAVSSTREHRLYGYTDLLSLLVIAELREQVSLQHIRRVLSHLDEHNYSVPEIVFAILGGSIYFQTPDGEWSGAAEPNQIVLKQVLDLQPLRARIRRVADRRTGTEGAVEKRRGARASKPLISGTRVPVAAVNRYLELEIGDDEILEAFPELSLVDIRRVRERTGA